MIDVLKITPIYSNQEILEVDKIGVTLKNKEKKGQDATISLILRETGGQELLTQDFELFIGGSKENEFIIPLEVPLGGGMPCEVKILVQIGGKTATESPWYDVIESASSDEGENATKPYATEFDAEEDTQTEIMVNEEEDPEPVGMEEEEDIKTEVEGVSGSDDGVTSSWGVLIEDGQEALYEATVESDLKPESEPEEEEDSIAASFQEEMEHLEEINPPEKKTSSPPKEPAAVTEEVELPVTKIEETPPEKEPVAYEDEELTPTLTENYEEPQEEELEPQSDEVLMPEVQEEFSEKKKFPALLIIIFLAVIIVGAGGYYFLVLKKKPVDNNGQKTVKTDPVKKDDNAGTDDSLDDLFSTDKDDILGDMTKKEYVVETDVLTEEQLGLLEPFMNKYGGNILETSGGYKLTFKFEEEQPAEDLRKEIKNQGVGSTISKQ